MSGTERRADAPGAVRGEECLLHDVNGHSASGHDVVPRGGGRGGAVPPAPVVPPDPAAAREPVAPAGRGGHGGPAAELEWDRAVELIHRADEVCLACHVVPDGDALGSMLALAQALRVLGKRCLASFGEPFDVPAILRFLPGQELLVDPGTVPAAPVRMISLDAAGQGPPRARTRSSSSTTTRPTPGSAACGWSTPTPRPRRSWSRS